MLAQPGQHVARFMPRSSSAVEDRPRARQWVDEVVIRKSSSAWICELWIGAQFIETSDVYCAGILSMSPHTRDMNTTRMESSRIAQLMLFAFGPNSDRFGQSESHPPDWKHRVFDEKHMYHWQQTTR